MFWVVSEPAQTCGLSWTLRGLAEAAACDDTLTGDPLCIVGGKEGYYSGDVIHTTCAAQGSLCDETLFEVGADEASGLRAFCIDDARVHGVNADLTRPEFFCKDASYGVERALGSSVDG